MPRCCGCVHWHILCTCAENRIHIMSIIGTFPTTIANGQVEDATVVMSLFAWIQSQTNGNACPATTGSAVLKGDGAGGTTVAVAGTDYVSPTNVGNVSVTGNVAGSVGLSAINSNAAGYGQLVMGSNGQTKTWRCNPSGTLELVNTANNAVVAAITDAGVLSTSGQIVGAAAITSQTGKVFAGISGLAGEADIYLVNSNRTNYLFLSADGLSTGLYDPGTATIRWSSNVAGDFSIAGKFNGAGTGLTGTAAALAVGSLSTASGAAPSFGARAWCVFDGTVAGTNAPIAGGNVTSVTRNGVGDYTVNFTTAMPDANYAAFISCQTVALSVTNNLNGVTAQTASARRIFVSSAGALSDSNLVTMCVFR